MIVILKPGATPADIERITAQIAARGLTPHISPGAEHTIIGVVGAGALSLKDAFTHDPAVAETIPVSKPYKLASREWHPPDSVITLPSGLTIGGPAVVVIAGPCAIENASMLDETAGAVCRAGAHILRGGAFKPRTSPYSFQGLGAEGLPLLRAFGDRYGLPVITEVTTPSDVPAVSAAADILQVGARNMQNFDLLREVGKQARPVLLKRGLSSTIEEWLLSAEYIMNQGNYQVILCERGIRTFETATRNTLDISAVPLLKELTHLPVMVDPSHATGKWSLVASCALAAVAAGADGVMLEVHPHPDAALSDGPQSLTPESLAALIPRLAAVANAIGRSLAPSPSR